MEGSLPIVRYSVGALLSRISADATYLSQKCGTQLAASSGRRGE